MRRWARTRQSSTRQVNISDSLLDDGCIPKQEWFVKQILRHVNGFTLDCGCARGLWSKKLRAKGIAVIGTDLSLRRLKMCKREKNNDMVVLSSCTHLPFRSSCFDSFLFLEVIEHIDRREQEGAVREIVRVLKDEGTLVVTTPNRPIYHILTRLFFKSNPEHVSMLSFRETKRLFGRHFRVIMIDGKIGFLDRLVPSALCWDLLFVLRKSHH